MKLLLKISPPFLRKLDAWLRTNHPWFWATQFHLHFYVALLLGLIFAAVGLFYQIDLKDVPSSSDQDGLFFLLLVPAAVFVVFMVYNMALFNPDKSFGYRFRYQEFFVLLIYYVSFLLPLVVLYSAGFVLNSRVAGMVGDEEFESDKYDVNYGRIFFPQYEGHNFFYYPNDSIYLAERAHFSSRNKTVDKNNEAIHASDRTKHEWAELKDSIFWHSGVFANQRPKLYYVARRLWVPGSNHDGYWPSNLEDEDMEDIEFSLYQQKLNITRDTALAAHHINRFCNKIKKYYKDTIMDEKAILFDFINHNYGISTYGFAFFDRAIDKTKANITSINRSKLRKNSVWQIGVFLVLAMIAFIFTLIFQVFKNVHWKQLLLSVAIIAILFTLLLIFEVAFTPNFQLIPIVGIIGPLLLLAYSITGFYASRFNWVLNQANILLSVILPFFPLLVLSYLESYHDIFHTSFFDQYKETYINYQGLESEKYSERYYETVKAIRTAVFCMGIVLYVFVWNSYLKALYLRYWALPKNT